MQGHPPATRAGPTSRRPAAGTVSLRSNDVSVVIVCDDDDLHLPAALAAVLAQGSLVAEVLIIDDACAPPTADLADRLAAGHPAIVVRHHSVRRGWAAACNEGLLWASARYALVASSRDVMTPGALSRAVRVLDGDAEVGLVYGRIATATEPAQGRPERRPRGVVVWSGSSWLLSRARLGAVRVPAATAVVRTTVQRRLGGYAGDADLDAGAAMWLRFARVSAIGFVDAVQSWRIEGRDGGRTALSAALRSLRGRRAAFVEVLQDGEGTARLLRIARRALARSAVRTAQGGLGSAVRREEVEALLAFAAETAPELMPRWRARWILAGSQLGPVPRRLLDAGAAPFRAWRRRREQRWEYGRRRPRHRR